MKKALIVTFGSILAMGSVAPAAAQSDYVGNLAVWVEGTYTESTNNGLSVGDYDWGPNNGTYVFFPNSLDGGKRSIFLHPENEFDYAIGLSYHIPSTCARFFVSYEHFDDEAETNVENVININLAPNLTYPSPIGTSEYAHVEHRADDFKIGLDYMMHTGPQFFFNVSGFLEYDKVRRDMIENIFQTDATFSRSYRTTEANVKGWGPGVGAMVRGVPSICHPAWGVFMGVKASLLYVDNDYRRTLLSPEDTDVVEYIYDPEETESVVGKLDMSFGINYARVLHSDMGGALIDIALGMRYMNMFNVFKNGNTYPQAYPLDDNFAVNLGHSDDWGRVGPFLRFKIGGASA